MVDACGQPRQLIKFDGLKSLDCPLEKTMIGMIRGISVGNNRILKLFVKKA